MSFAESSDFRTEFKMTNVPTETLNVLLRGSRLSCLCFGQD